jgi:hypothetical protein
MKSGGSKSFRTIRLLGGERQHARSFLSPDLRCPREQETKHRRGTAVTCLHMHPMRRKDAEHLRLAHCVASQRPEIATQQTALAEIGQSVGVPIPRRYNRGVGLGAAVDAEKADRRLGVDVAARAANGGAARPIVVHAEMPKPLTALGADQRFALGELALPPDARIESG